MKLLSNATILLAITLFVLLSASSLSYAAEQGAGGGAEQGAGGGAEQNAGTSGGLNNPLGEGSTLIGFIQEILDVIMIFAVPIIVFFIIYAGFMYVTAQGNQTKVETAHRALLYAVIGGVLIIGAEILLEVIGGTVDALGS